VAFLSLTSSQVDANSTLDETLFQLIRTNFDDLNTRIVAFDEYGFLPNADKLFLNVNSSTDLASAITDNSPDFG